MQKIIIKVSSLSRYLRICSCIPIANETSAGLEVKFMRTRRSSLSPLSSSSPFNLRYRLTLYIHFLIKYFLKISISPIHGFVNLLRSDSKNTKNTDHGRKKGPKISFCSFDVWSIGVRSAGHAGEDAQT